MSHADALAERKTIEQRNGGNITRYIPGVLLTVQHGHGARMKRRTWRLVDGVARLDRKAA